MPAAGSRSAAVDVEGDAGYEPGHVPGQVDGGGCNVVDVADRLEGNMSGAASGVVDKDVQPPEPLAHVPGELAHGVPSPDVELADEGRPPGRLDVGGGGGQVLGVAVAHGHVGTEAGEGQGDGATNAHGGAG